MHDWACDSRHRRIRCDCANRVTGPTSRNRACCEDSIQKDLDDVAVRDALHDFSRAVSYRLRSMSENQSGDTVNFFDIYRTFNTDVLALPITLKEVFESK